MVKKSKAKVEANPSEELQKLQEENQNLKLQLQVVSDLSNLRDEGYYRQQQLMLQERQAKALECLCQLEKVRNDLLEVEEAEEDLDEEEESEEESEEAPEEESEDEGLPEIETAK